MKWISIKEGLPDYGENSNFLVTDGKSVHVAYMDKDELWFLCDPRENYSELIKRLTHWGDFSSIILPKDIKQL